MSDCIHTTEHPTILVTQHFDGNVQPVYTRECVACGEMLLDQRQIRSKKS